ncbi:hypothetical protein N7G274_006545 [Stereocaulon virgatum]|uniref:Uncharacterized protein n=1 Tax=Stereocaulon virgatum TaxID=373712 RepID=A0ABR4A6N1_9LECA
MGDRSRSGWDSMHKFQNIQKALRQFDQREREDQLVTHRGWQKTRKDKPAEASNPPAPSRPPYGHAQQTFSDPGPQTGQSQGHGSSPPQNQYSHGQYVDSNAGQGYHQHQQVSTYPPQTGSAYQSSFQAPYGQNQQAQPGPPPPSSAQYASHNQGYQSPPQSSGVYQQGSQFSQPYSSGADPYSQGITHNTQNRSMGPNAINGSHGGYCTDQSLSRIASAPAANRCQFNIPNGLCTGCKYHDKYGRPHR